MLVNAPCVADNEACTRILIFGGVEQLLELRIVDFGDALGQVEGMVLSSILIFIDVFKVDPLPPIVFFAAQGLCLASPLVVDEWVAIGRVEEVIDHVLFIMEPSAGAIIFFLVPHHPPRGIN